MRSSKPESTASTAAVPFIVLGLCGLYTLEFGVVGILPQLSAAFHIGAPEAASLMGVFALAVALCGPLLVLYSSQLVRKRVGSQYLGGDFGPRTVAH